jgi:citronellol/citronellal dehydrogenase
MAADRELAGRTALITGGVRGIGAAIAARLATAGANVALFDKAAEPQAGSGSTATERVEAAGGRALTIVGDLRRDEDVESAVARTVAEFGGLDIVVNNAAAFDTTPTAAISMKRYDLLHAVNTRGSFLVSRTTLPHLEKSPAAHILSVSPPLTLDPSWLGAHLAYTASRYAVSLATLGLAHELAERGIAANSLWPSTSIGTEAIRVILGEDVAARRSRRPEVMADAAFAILRRDPRSCTGNLFTDEEVLRSEDVTDFAPYRLGDSDDELEASWFLPGSSAR